MRQDPPKPCRILKLGSHSEHDRPLLGPVPDLVERLSLGRTRMRGFTARGDALARVRATAPEGEPWGVAQQGRGGSADLINAATGGGAKALGLPAGRVEAGHWADLVVIDLDHPSLAGCEVETLAESLVSGADNGVVRGTYVGGNWRAGSSELRANRAGIRLPAPGS